jgi:hypothetical protein
MRVICGVLGMEVNGTCGVVQYSFNNDTGVLVVLTNDFAIL